MDAAAFEQVYGTFQDFHAYFAARFCRRETRDHSRRYLQALLVQSGERRNAENLLSRVNYICRLASISFAGSPPGPGPVAGQRWSGSWGRQTPG